MKTFWYEGITDGQRNALLTGPYKTQKESKRVINAMKKATRRVWLEARSHTFRSFAFDKSQGMGRLEKMFGPNWATAKIETWWCRFFL